MKLIPSILFCSIFLFSSISNATSNDTTPSVNWAALKSAFEEYANYPTGDNAKKATALLPSEHISYTGEEDEDETIKFIYERYQLGMLERQVISGERQAVRLAYNLISIADGAFAEDLDIMLGQLIRINPTLFLEGLNEYQGLVERFDALAGNKGDVYVDRLKAQCYEMKLRIDSLSKVKEPHLKYVKNKCIEALRDSLNRYCKTVVTKIEGLNSEFPDVNKDIALTESDSKPIYLNNEDYVSTGCSGGVTGSGSATIITRGGRVLSQQIDIRNKPEPKEIGSVGNAADQLFEELDRISFFTIEHNNPKNWTCFLMARINGKSHNITLDKGTPKNVQKLAKLFIKRIKEGGISGNIINEETGEEDWNSGIKKIGSN